MGINIFVSGPISATSKGREDVVELMPTIEKYGVVLNKHFFSDFSPDKSIEEKEAIFVDNLTLLQNADCIIANISHKSAGVGFEMGYAYAYDIPTLCLLDEKDHDVLTLLLELNDKLNLATYNSFDELENVIKTFIATL